MTFPSDELSIGEYFMQCHNVWGLLYTRRDCTVSPCCKSLGMDEIEVPPENCFVNGNQIRFGMCRVAFHRDIVDIQVFQIVEQVLHLRNIRRQKGEGESFLFELVVHISTECPYPAKPPQYNENLVFIIFNQDIVRASMNCLVDIFPIP